MTQPLETLDQHEAIVDYAGPEYTSLIRTVEQALSPHHRTISYVPYTGEQKLEALSHLSYLSPEDLEEKLETADAVICISRDEDLNPNYDDAYPTHNIVLTPSGASNVAKSSELYQQAHALGNQDMLYISTGRMHNRAVGMMLALPIVADMIGINPEDIYHTPEAQFETALGERFDLAVLRKRYDSLNEDDDTNVRASYKALVKILADAGIAEESTSEQAIQSIIDRYKNYPRVSTSRLMIERAVELGVPLEAILEEDGAVDTITNLLFTRQMLEARKAEGYAPVKSIVIVAGSDQLPRTTWIANHILPDGIDITCVESNPALSPEAYATSCKREEASFLKGSNWIGGTRDPQELEKIVEKGYFGVDRVDAKELAQHVATAALKSM